LSATQNNNGIIGPSTKHVEITFGHNEIRGRGYIPGFCVFKLYFPRRKYELPIAQILLEPFHYIGKLPGKGIRPRMIAAFNEWLQVSLDCRFSAMYWHFFLVAAL
jgi:hypothetical protein